MKNKNLLPITFILGLILGGTGTYFYQDQKDKPIAVPLTSFYNDFFDRDLFSGKTSPFEQMEKMRKEMDKLTFDDWYQGRFGGDISEIKQTEDEKYVYYRINLEGLDRDSVRVDVINGQLNVFGEKNAIEAQEDKDNNTVSKSAFHQSFQRSFPVPEGVDDSRVKVTTEDNEIVVQFPKKRDLI